MKKKKRKTKHLNTLEIQSTVLIFSTSVHCLYLILVREMPQLLVLFFVNGFLTIDILKCSLQLLCYTKHALTLQSNLYHFSTVQFGYGWMPIKQTAIGSAGLTKLTGSWEKYLRMWVKTIDTPSFQKHTVALEEKGPSAVRPVLTSNPEEVSKGTARI